MPIVCPENDVLYELYVIATLGGPRAASTVSCRLRVLCRWSSNGTVSTQRPCMHRTVSCPYFLRSCLLEGLLGGGRVKQRGVSTKSGCAARALLSGRTRWPAKTGGAAASLILWACWPLVGDQAQRALARRAIRWSLSRGIASRGIASRGTQPMIQQLVLIAHHAAEPALLAHGACHACCTGASQAGPEQNAPSRSGCAELHRSPSPRRGASLRRTWTRSWRSQATQTPYTAPQVRRPLCRACWQPPCSLPSSPSATQACCIRGKISSSWRPFRCAPAPCTAQRIGEAHMCVSASSFAVSAWPSRSATKSPNTAGAGVWRRAHVAGRMHVNAACHPHTAACAQLRSAMSTRGTPVVVYTRKRS